MPDPVLIGGVVKLGMGLIDRLFPDQQARDKAKLELIAMEQAGELKELEVRMSAIIAEAQSSDPWTSRARPSFLYCIYVLILSAIPFGFLSAFHPDIASQVSTGFGAWLQAIPGELYTLFGAGYLGYSHMRTQDKKNLFQRQ